MKVDRFSNIMSAYKRCYEKERYANTIIITLLENDDYSLMKELLDNGFPSYTFLSNHDHVEINRIIYSKFNSASPSEIAIIYKSMLSWFPLIKLAKQHPESFEACMPHITNEAAGKLLSYCTSTERYFLQTRYGLTSNHVCFHN